MKILLLASIAALSGCANLEAQNAAYLAQSKPLPMYTLECEGYVVFSGLPIPLGIRMPDLDKLCKDKQVK